jgi:hypothetical protein
LNPIRDPRKSEKFRDFFVYIVTLQLFQLCWRAELGTLKAGREGDVEEVLHGSILQKVA